jgi:hypothetical protein
MFSNQYSGEPHPRQEEVVAEEEEVAEVEVEVEVEEVGDLLADQIQPSNQ